jgi:hypothetical protein
MVDNGRGRLHDGMFQRIDRRFVIEKAARSYRDEADLPETYPSAL